MPWQRLVADVGGEYDPETGIPCYREVVVTVPRQSGKTTLILAWEVQRAVGWSQRWGPQRIAYSAQTGNDARKKLIEDQVPLLLPHQKALGIKRILKGMGNEAVEFLNGSRIILLASSQDSGHGKTIDLGVKDELFADMDDRRDQALVPAMATRPGAQALTASTMGTSESYALNAAVDRGREAVMRDLREGVAYFEWSADPGADPDDPATWRTCMPALGFTITEQVVAHARATLSVPEFRRAFLNIPDSMRADPVISPDDWVGCHARDSRVRHPVVFAFDVSPDRSTASIAVAGESQGSDGVHVEIVENRSGFQWTVPRIVEIVGRWSPALVVCDAASPAGALIAPLAAEGVEVRTVSAREHTQACGGFYDAVKARTLRHIGQPELDEAINGADRRTVADAWLWSRRTSAVDISPVVAVTLAHWAHGQAEDPEASASVW
jgi:phage terminase large subunit-like protein